MRLPYVIIEHIEQDFPRGAWCSIEYANIARIVGPKRIIVTNISEEHEKNLPSELQNCASITRRSLTTLIDNPADEELSSKQAALDAADETLHPLVKNIRAAASVSSAEEKECRICFLDAHAKEELSPDDVFKFDYFIVGGYDGNTHESIQCYCILMCYS